MGQPSISRAVDHALKGAPACWLSPQAPFAANISCNHSCAHRLADDDFFNLQDTTIARARPAYITSIPAVAQARGHPPACLGNSARLLSSSGMRPLFSCQRQCETLAACNPAAHPNLTFRARIPEAFKICLAMVARLQPPSSPGHVEVQVPVADLTRASDGSVPAVPMYYLPRGELANATASAGLRFRMLRSNQSSYVNELSHLAYFVAQAALGNKRCSPGCAFALLVP
jgi:hypothetical protein